MYCNPFLMYDFRLVAKLAETDPARAKAIQDPINKFVAGTLLHNFKKINKFYAGICFYYTLEIPIQQFDMS